MNRNKLLKGIKNGMNLFGQTISIIVNTVLLTIVYFIGVGITSIIAKLFKKKFLQTKISKKRESYWTALNLKKNKMETYYRQF
ncbi:hypothetical protein HN587_05665 [Candidatus Woesearchaeota archaeon]|jgi:cytochrome c biogenesis protein CcdA|nr:hypothetical protein [Candidatus Woesearchaeota archaeon]